ncbi:MAG: type II secretion system GspH family protein [Oscillospiraceae bacterium]|nr:type II secretion system GspH family protein [Oscillospiraceae bacterium]
MKHLYRLRAKKGFTLVELICAIAIFTLLTAAIVMMLEPVNRIRASIKGDAEAMGVATSVESYMARQMMTATDIKIFWMSAASWGSLNYRETASATPTSIPTANGLASFGSFHMGALDNPQALIIKKAASPSSMVYIYNIRLKGLSAASISSIINDPVLLEEYRVFNPSFYSNLVLELSIRTATSGAGSNVKTHMLVTIDTARINPVTGLPDYATKARKESLTTLVNIGREKPKVNPTDPVKHYEIITEMHGLNTFTNLTNSSVPFNTIRLSGGDDYDGWQGDYIILYNVLTAEPPP